MPTAPERFAGVRRQSRSHMQDRTRDRHAFLNSSQWLAIRRRVLADQPLCVECQKQGVVTAATDVDHIKPRHIRPDLATDFANLQALCHKCHSKKTRREMQYGC